MIPLLTTCILIALELIYFSIAKRFGIVDRPNERSSHSKVTLLGGGIIFFLAIVVYSLLHGLAFPGLLISVSLLAIVSFVDDIKPLPSWVRLIVQFASIILAFYPQISTLEVWKIVLVIIVFVGILNIYNFMDGINGMLAGYSLVVVGTFGYIDLFVNRFVDPELIYAILTSILIFGFFNFRTKARCFSGDVGSIVMGLIILFLFIKMVKSNTIYGIVPSYLTFIMVFLADGGLTIFKRYLAGKNIFNPHREHLYETLTNNLKIPHIYVSTGYALLQLVINVGYFLVKDKNLYALLCACILTIAYSTFFNRFLMKQQSN